MTAAKLTKPFVFLRKRCSLQQLFHLFSWVRKVSVHEHSQTHEHSTHHITIPQIAKPRAIIELQKTAKQKAQAHLEEKDCHEKSKVKELEVATEWEVVRNLSEKERVTSGADLKKQLEKLKGKGLKMSYLKKQRKFLFLLGVNPKKAPTLSYSTPTGERTNFSPDEFCDHLGKVIDLFEAGAEELCKDLKPIESIASKLDQFSPFRGGRMTKFMEQYIENEKKQLSDMVGQTAEAVNLRMSRLEEARKRKPGKQPSWLKKGATVWVADEDDLDEEADQRVWQATVHKKAPDRKVEGKLVKDWWSLDFGKEVSGKYDYVSYNIFETEVDARVNLLV